jgi:glycogen synthase
MNILLLSNEYPPHIYGGAGVHVDYLCRELTRLDDAAHRLQVLCFGDQNKNSGNHAVSGIPEVNGWFLRPPPHAPHTKLLDALGRNLVMTGSARDAEVVHCHTWYTHLAGCLIKQSLEIPLVITVHSLEPHRPWKREQLGSGYNVSSWLEKTALQNADGIIAVSGAMKKDVIDLYGVAAERVRVIYNGIDVREYRHAPDPEVLRAYGIDPHRPYVLFVGRITRQKGIVHLVNAIPSIDPGVQIVLCAGAPDTAEIAAEMAARVEAARAGTGNTIVWIREMVPRERIVPIYSQAALFVCPSVYEPFGLINLEAMACETPVVAAAVGGIPEVVVHGQTGLLVPFEPAGPGDPEPRDPAAYSRDLADAVNRLLRRPEELAAMGRASRRRVEANFSWAAIARQTVDFYRELGRR